MKVWSFCCHTSMYYAGNNLHISYPFDSLMYVIHMQLWSNVLMGFKRLSFDVGRPIRVLLIGKPSEDAGGPTCELFTLCVQEMVFK